MENIIVFGIGKYFNYKKDSLKKIYNVTAFLDNSIIDKKWNDEFKCYIYNPKAICNLGNNEKILCMSLDYIEMCNQLIRIGVNSNRILLGINILPYYNFGEKILESNGKMIVTKKGVEYEYRNIKYKMETKQQVKDTTRIVAKNEIKDIQNLMRCNCYPVDKTFGRDMGKPVDRIYIEEFLRQNSSFIKGTVMEIESDDYIKRFGANKVDKEIILHVKGWGGDNVLKGNFETGEGLTDEMVDCLICTQTLQYIYNLSCAAKNINKILKKNGVALITVPGVKSLSEFHDKHWGEYWSFTEKSLFRLFSDVFGENNVEVNSYGNVKATTAYLYGLPAECLTKEELNYNDKQFPFIISAKVRKNVE